MKKLYFLIFLLSAVGLSAQNNITFSVDMSGQSFTQAYISGSFNGWSGDANALTDMTGGIWEITLPIADGEYEYKFTYDNWVGQDAFNQGDICTITNYGNTNRRLVVAGADQTLTTVAFGSCASSGGTFNITFNLDMSAYTGTLGAVQVNGENYNAQGFGNWCGACAPTLTDMGSSMYSITMPLEEFAYQFKFTVDGWTDQESFTPGDTETSTDGTFTNRYIQVDQDKTVNFVWNNPMTLDTQDNEIMVNFEVYPNPSKDVWNIKTNNQTINSIHVFDLLGKQYISLTPNNVSTKIDASTLPSGLYFATIKTGKIIKTVKLIKK